MAGWPSRRATAKTSRGKSFTGHSIPAYLLHSEYKRWQWQFLTADLPVTLGTPELECGWTHRFGNSQAEVAEEVWLLSTAGQNWERQQADKPVLVLEIQWLVYEVLGSILSTGERRLLGLSLLSGNNTNEVFVFCVYVCDMCACMATCVDISVFLDCTPLYLLR